MKLITRLMMLVLLLGTTLNGAAATTTAMTLESASYCDSYQPDEAPAHCMKTECSAMPGCPCGASACFYSKLSLPFSATSLVSSTPQRNYQYIYLYRIHRPPKAA